MKNKSLIFYLLFFLSLFLFLIAPFINKESPIYNKITVTVEAPFDTSILIKSDNEIFKPELKENVFNKTFTNKIKNLNILVKKDETEKIKTVTVFNDTKINPYFDIKKFKQNEDIATENTIFESFEIPNDIKTFPDAEFLNQKTTVDFLSSYFLSMFEFNGYLIFPYIFIIFTIFYFLNNKNEIYFPKNICFIITVFLFAAAIIIRFNNLFSYNFHLDEYCSLFFSGFEIPFPLVFEDSGNPPLYYILLQLWLLISKSDFVIIKLFPFVLSLLGAFIFYIVLKKEFSKEAACLGLFVYSVNLPLIYYSQELRSYILQAAIIPLGIYFLFKILNEEKLKYYIIYAVFTAAAMNIHYYMALFIFSNFLYASFILLKRKNYIGFLKFLNANIFGALAFAPWFCLIAKDYALLDEGFNDWIVLPDTEKIKNILFYIFFGFYSLILSLCFFIKSLIQKNKNKIDVYIIYLFFTLCFIFVSSLIFSYLVKPIFVERYFTLLIPLFIIFFVLSTMNLKNKKIAVLIFIIWLFLIQAHPFDNDIRKKGIIDYPLISSLEFSKNNVGNKNVYAVTNLLERDYKFNHLNYLTHNVNYITETSLSFENSVNEVLNYDKSAVIFVVLADENKINAKITKFYNPSSKSSLMKIEN